jgi:methionyl-tRNA formyltransferase
MAEILNISILTDPKSWMVTHSKHLAQVLVKMGHRVTFITSKADIPAGDILFLLSVSEIISPEKLKLNTQNIVVHGSALPLGKGMSPVSWQILEGKNDIPLTLFEAVEAMDAGKIYLHDKLSLKGDELIIEWQAALGAKIVEMCALFVQKRGQLVGRAQVGKSTFYGRRTPDDSRLDVHKSIVDQFNLLRIVDNTKYPAFFIHKGQKYILRIEKDAS